MLCGSFCGTLGVLIVPAYSPQSHQILSSWYRYWKVQALVPVQPMTWGKEVLMSGWSHINSRELNETRRVEQHTVPDMWASLGQWLSSPSSGTQGTQ